MGTVSNPPTDGQSGCASVYCDGPASEPRTGLCRYHWVVRLGKDRPREILGELDALLDQLGIGHGVPLYRYEFDGEIVDPRWRAYRVEMVAVAPPSTWWRGYPHSWTLMLPDEAEPRTVVRWRVWQDGKPASLTVTWQPRVKTWVMTAGPLRERTQLEAFLEAMRTRLKPGQTPELTPAELRAALIAAIRAERKRLRKRPPLHRLALYFSEDPSLPHGSEDALRKRIRRAQLNLEALHREAMATS